MISIILYLILFIYFVVIMVLIYGFDKVVTINFIALEPKTKFTIIVPFRNEAENLPVLLDHFSVLNYPNMLFEVILVDDESRESFNLTSKNFKVSIINNIRISNSPKKDAITTAINSVSSDWIITTDADCLISKNWLLTIDNYIQLHDVSMIAGAVSYNSGNSFLDHFQQLDMASLQGATIGSFGINKGFMCNGANFAYTKSIFIALNGFEGNNTIASGDDVFLLQKAIAAFPKKVHYLKSNNTVVFTKPVDTWRSLFHQRLRWASKTNSYKSVFAKTLALIVFLGNLGVVVIFAMGLLNLFFLILLKFAIDFILIYKSNTFLTSIKMKQVLLSSLLYPFLSVSIALYSFFGKYEWKERRF